MIEKLLQRLGRGHVCRDTTFEVKTEDAPGQPCQLLLVMHDKCTGARYEANFTRNNAEQIADKIRDTVDGMR